MRGRLFLCAAVVVALTAGFLPRSLGGARPAAALDPTCHNFGLPFPSFGLPIAVDDGVPEGTAPALKYKYETTWNTPLAVPQSGGVLINDFDGIGQTEEDLRDLDGLEAFRSQQNEDGSVTPVTGTLATAYGAVTLNETGAFTYTPRFTVSPPPPHGGLVDSFHYLALQSHNGLCSAVPATVYIHVDGFTETVDFAPKASPDSYPTDRAAMSADDVLTIPAPGVLANDYNGVTHLPNDNVQAILVSQPVWHDTHLSAGTITDWGVEMLQGVPVADNSGGFKFTPNQQTHGVAEFTYTTCYVDRPATATACSDPVTVSIEVGVTTVARPVTMFLKGLYGTIYFNELRANTTWNAAAPPQLWFSQPSHGTLTQFEDRFVLGDGRALFYLFGSGFTGQDQAEYWYCDTPQDGSVPPTICTNHAPLNIVLVLSTPHVTDVVPPDAPTKPVVVKFSELVKGITADNLTLVDISGTTPIVVPAEITCRLSFESGFSDCSRQADVTELHPLEPLVEGRDYKLRANEEVKGIVSLTDPFPALEPYQSSFRPDYVVVDSSGPVASPTQSPAANAAGWNNGDVTVTWNWSDGTGSGVDPAHCTQTTTTSGQGAQVSVAATCTDLSGNTSLASYDLKIDKTGPVPSPVLSPAANTAGWNNGDVTVTWNWSDTFGAGIDPARCTRTSTSSGEGRFILAAACTDSVGNFTLAQVDLNIDRSAPVPSPTLSPAANAAGWNNDGMTVDWNWSDEFGSGIDPAHCTQSSSPPADGRYILTASCTDRAGNTAIASQEVKIDEDGPVATPTQSPAANAVGWNTSDVTVDWNWSDGPGSGVDPARCTTTSHSAGQGLDLEVTGACTDVAGNTTTTRYFVKVDRIAPNTLVPTQSPPANAAGWNKSDVTVTWHWNDGNGSGIDPANCAAKSTSLGEGASIAVNGTCTDIAGNTRNVSRNVMVDTTAPSLAPTISPNPVLLGSVASASPHATDSTSGVASSSCGPIDTSTIGAKTVQCTATDVAGNVTTRSVPYVVGFGIANLAPPSRSKFKAGNTIPMKFQLNGANGKPIAASLAQSLPACAAKVTIGTQSPVCAVFDPRTNYFQANVKAPANTPVGTELPIRVTVTIGTATVATASTSIVITK